jgi:hypothetical protein
MSRKRTPDQALEPGDNNATATATEEPTPDAPSANGNGQTFAERVGRKKFTPAPDPFGIAMDNLAGVRLYESRNPPEMAIKFGEGKPEDKPSQRVIDLMKEHDYRWTPSDRVWKHPVRYESARTTRIDAERLFQEVVKLIREERGIPVDQGLSR